MAVGLIGLINSVDKFDTSKGIWFKTYASRCIENEILKFIRKNKKYLNDTSLNCSIGRDKKVGKGLELVEIWIDDNADFVLDYENRELHKMIRRLVFSLPERDKNIILKYFGFIDDYSMTQLQIADEIGLSQSSVSKAIKRLLQGLSIQLKELGMIEVEKAKQKVK